MSNGILVENENLSDTSVDDQESWGIFEDGNTSTLGMEDDAGALQHAPSDEVDETTQIQDSETQFVERWVGELRPLAKSVTHAEFRLGNALLLLKDELSSREAMQSKRKYLLSEIYRKLGLSNGQAQALKRVVEYIIEKSSNQVDFSDDDDPVLTMCAEIGHSKLDRLRRLPSDKVKFTDDNRVVLTGVGNAVEDELDARVLSFRAIQELRPTNPVPTENTSDHTDNEPGDSTPITGEEICRFGVMRYTDRCSADTSAVPRSYTYLGGQLTSGENGFSFSRDTTARIAFCVEEEVNPQTGAITGTNRMLRWFDAETDGIVSFNLPNTALDEPNDEEQRS